MNKFLTIAAAAVLMTVAAPAQQTDVTLGYCSGQLPSGGNYSYPEKDVWVSAAIFVPGATLTTFSGNDLVGVRAGLASKLNIDELQVWVRSDLEGENLASQTVTSTTDPKLAKGWNEVSFDTPYSLTDENVAEGLYIGYSYHQKGSAFGVAALERGCADAFWVKFGDQPWEDRSAEGTLCVEALLEGSAMPQVNLALTRVEADELYVIERGSIGVRGTVQNRALQTVTGFDVSALIDGQVVGTSRVECEVPYNNSYDFSVSLPLGITEVGEGSGSMTVRIDGIAEGEDENRADNELTAEFTIVEHDFTKRILVEEFTTESCSNCPRIAGWAHNLLEMEEYSDRVLMVAHHAGYGTDWLSIGSDSDYLWFYGSGGAYAPAMMVDRIPYQGSGCAVFLPASQDEMEAAWRARLEEPALISVNVAAAYDEQDPAKLHVTVSGVKQVETLGKNTSITVALVENDIPARAQSGAGAGYIQQHVNRRINSTWGAVVPFEGNNYTYECEFGMASSWKRENMEVIAFINNNDRQDIANCEIYNAGRLQLVTLGPVAIDAVQEDPCDAETEYFTLDGIRIETSGLQPGIYVKRSGSQVSKVVIR